MSSFDNGTLNVGSLGFPSSGYILGINATGGIYTTNTSNQSTLTIPLSTLTSLTTGTFIVGYTYPMTAVFSTTLPAVASITINPPNSSDTIASASVSASTLTFNWTPVTAVTNSPFSFVFGIQTVQSANYTTTTTYPFTTPTLIFQPSGISQTSGNVTSWKDTTSVATYTVGTGTPTYDSTNNCVNLNAAQLTSTYNPTFTDNYSFAILYNLNSVAVTNNLIDGTNMGFYSNTTPQIMITESGGNSFGAFSCASGTWYSYAVTHNYSGNIINWNQNMYGTGNGTGLGTSVPSTLPPLGSSTTNCKIKAILFWKNYILTGSEMTAVDSFLNAFA